MQLFGKWKIKKEKKSTPLELVATDGSAKLSIMTMPTNGDYHLWSKVRSYTLLQTIPLHCNTVLEMDHLGTRRLLVSAGHLCDLQGLFSEFSNLCRMNRNELQLSS